MFSTEHLQSLWRPWLDSLKSGLRLSTQWCTRTHHYTSPFLDRKPGVKDVRTTLPSDLQTAQTLPPQRLGASKFWGLLQKLTPILKKKVPKELAMNRPSLSCWADCSGKQSSSVEAGRPDNLTVHHTISWELITDTPGASGGNYAEKRGHNSLDL